MWRPRAPVANAAALALLALLALPAAVTAKCASPFPYTVAATATTGPGSGCVSFPGIAGLPQGPFYIKDSFPMPYFVTAPCRNVTRAQTNCTSFADATQSAPAWADSAGECYSLGQDASMSALRLLTPGDVNGGVSITFSGGVGGRAVSYHLTCDMSAKPNQGQCASVTRFGCACACACARTCALRTMHGTKLTF